MVQNLKIAESRVFILEALFRYMFMLNLTLGLPWGPMDPKTIFNLMDLLHLLSAGYGTP